MKQRSPEEMAFESISTSIQSTGDVLTELYGLLGDESISKLDLLDIAKLIKKENDLNSELFEMQRRLIEAEIRELIIREGPER